MSDHSYKKRYGPWALVTGASSGIGREVAYELARRGLDIILVGRDENALQDSADVIHELGQNTHMIKADLSTGSEIEAILKATEKFDIGLFVASAGFGITGEFINTAIENELNMIDVNCKAVVQMTQFYAKVFVQKKRGGIILFSSLVGFQGTPYSTNYAATKGFIQIFAEGLHHELKPYHVDVLCVAPGPVATGFRDRSNMKMGLAARAESIAPEIIAKLGQTTTIRPGFLSKFFGYSLMLLPHSLRINVMARIMGKMSGTQ